MSAVIRGSASVPRQLYDDLRNARREAVDLAKLAACTLGQFMKAAREALVEINAAKARIQQIVDPPCKRVYDAPLWQGGKMRRRDVH
jgi:hypothetical protein